MDYPVVYDPSKFNLPEIRTFEDAKNNITGLLKCALSTQDIDLSENEYALPVIFKGYELILIVKKRKSIKDFYEFSIEDESENKEFYCMYLTVVEYSGKIVGKILLRNVERMKCKFPKSSTQKWILEFADSLFTSLGLPISILQDNTEIYCKNEFVPGKSLMLRIFRGEYQSWYEDLGYIPFLDSKRVIDLYGNYNLEEYKKDMNFLNGINMTTVKEQVNKYVDVLVKNVAVPKDLYNFILEIVEKGKKIIFGKKSVLGLHLGGFMENLWNRDCKKYVDAIKFFILTSEPFFDQKRVFEWSNLLNKIKFVGYEYKKNLKSPKDCIDKDFSKVSYSVYKGKNEYRRILNNEELEMIKFILENIPDIIPKSKLVECIFKSEDKMMLVSERYQGDFENYVKSKPDHKEYVNVIKQIINKIILMGKTGILHGDMHWGNFVYKKHGKEVDFRIIDFEGASLYEKNKGAFGASLEPYSDVVFFILALDNNLINLGKKYEKYILWPDEEFINKYIKKLIGEHNKMQEGKEDPISLDEEGYFDMDENKINMKTVTRIKIPID